MNEVIVQVIQTVISVSEIWLCYQLLYLTVLEKEYFRKKEKVIISGNIIILGILLAMNRNIVFFSNNMFILYIAITYVSVIFLNKRNKICSIGIITLYYSSVALLDFFFAFVSMIIFKQEFEAAVYWHSISIYRNVIFACSRIIVAGCIISLKKKVHIKEYMFEFRNVILLIDTVLIIIIGLYQKLIVDMSSGTREMKGGIAGISLLFVILIIVIIGVLLLKNKMVQKENEFLQLQDELLSHNYQELESVVEQNRLMLHDIKNHFLVLKELEKEKDYDGISRYLKEIEQEFLKVTMRRWTGHRFADVMLEQKKAKAEQLGIEFDIQSVPISKWPINDSEICSLFGNLLDNAIEACERKKDGDRWIWVKIERQKQLLFINISNAIDEAPVMKNGRLISKKQGRKIHGYGLKSVERIVNKYDGTICYDISKNVFKVELFFCGMGDTL